jgi:hypothetical protein
VSVNQLLGCKLKYANMGRTLSILILTFLIGCHSGNSTSKKISNNDDSLTNFKSINFQYSAEQLEFFLDSIGKLNSRDLLEKASYYSDSIFVNQPSIDFSLNNEDFEALKNACKSGKIDLKFVKIILKDVIIDSSYLKLDTIPLTFISFDKNKYDFNEFTICAGYSDIGWHCELYFFKGNRIISKHNIYHRYGLDLNHYLDFDGKTVFYYKENYQSGSGIWWFNFYFYKYDSYKIIPILNELENANLQFPWHIRVLGLKSTVIKTNPLTIKMVYYQDIPDSTNNIHRIINDSTIINYKWNNTCKTLIGDYSKSKISKAQITSFYLADNELLFINSYNNLLKEKLHDSMSLRQATLKYLGEVKAHYDKIKR